MSMRKLIAVSIAVTFFTGLVSAPAEQQNPGPPRQELTVGVAEFEIKNSIGLENAGVIIPELLVGNLKEADVYKLSERILLEKALEEQQLQMSGLTDEETIGKVGKIYNLDAVVGGSAMQVAGTIRISGRLIDTESGEIIEAATVTFSTLDRLEDKLRELGYRLSGWSSAEYERMALRRRMSRSRYGVRLGTGYQFNSYYGDGGSHGVFAPVALGFFFHSRYADAELAGNIPHLTSSSSHVTLSAFFNPFLHIGFGLAGSYLYDGISADEDPSATAEFVSLMAGINYRANESLRAQFCIGPTLSGSIIPTDNDTQYSLDPYFGAFGLANVLLTLEYHLTDSFSLQLLYLMQSGEASDTDLDTDFNHTSNYLTLTGGYSFSLR